MKRILTAAALLLVVAACNKDENYNDKYGDRAVIPPTSTAPAPRAPRMRPTWTRSPK